MKFFATTALLFSVTTTSFVSGERRQLRATTKHNRRSEELRELTFWKNVIVSDLDSMLVPEVPIGEPTSTPTLITSSSGSGSGSTDSNSTDSPTEAQQEQSETLVPTSDATSGPIGSPTGLPTGLQTGSPTLLNSYSDTTRISNSEVIFQDILNVVSYTTFCRAGEYTSVQIIGVRDEEIYCITNFEGAGVEFGYEQDYPGRPIIKLNIEPPTEADCEAKDDETEESKNFCNFLGKANVKPMSRAVNNLENDDEVELSIADTASYTTYCNEGGYTNVEIVTFDGTVDCITNLPGATAMYFYDPTTGSVVEELDLEPSVCEIGPESRNITGSFPCGFTGLATTEYVNFFENDNGNSTNTTLG